MARVDVEAELRSLSKSRFSEWTRSLASLPSSELKLGKESQLFRDFVSKHGYTNNIVEIFDYWLDNVLEKQVSARSLMFKNAYIRFERVQVSMPGRNMGGTVIPLMPKFARECGYTYSGNVYAYPVAYNERHERIAAGDKILLGDIPIMLGSKRCHLGLMTPEQRILAGECPNDAMGYFIIKGMERSIIIQEKLRTSMVLTTETKGILETRITNVVLTGTTIVTIAVDKKWQTLHVRLQHLRDKKTIPLFTLFNIMGCTPEQAMALILQFVPPQYVRKVWFSLQPSIADDASKGADRIAYVASLRRLNESKTITDPRKVVVDDIRRELFSNLSDDRVKLDHFAMMAAHITLCLLGLRPIDDRDSWANKRLETPARNMEQLFNGLWNKMINVAQGKIDAKGAPVILPSSDLTTISRQYIEHKILTDEMISSFSSNEWGVKGSTKKKENITDSVKRDTPLAVYSQAHRINTPANRKAKQMAIRMLQPTQLGGICIAETPEGDNVGLVKNLALSCYISMERDLSSLFDVIRSGALAKYISLERNDVYKYLFTVNGQIMYSDKTDGTRTISWCTLGLRDELLRFRRNDKLPRDSCIFFNQTDQIIEYYCDSARPTRPLLIVNESGNLVMDEKKLWGQPMDVLFAQGAIELVDLREQEYIMLAQFPDDVRERVTKKMELKNALERKGVEMKIREPLPAIAEIAEQAVRRYRTLILTDGFVDVNLIAMKGYQAYLRHYYDSHISAVMFNSEPDTEKIHGDALSLSYMFILESFKDAKVNRDMDINAVAIAESDTRDVIRYLGTVNLASIIAKRRVEVVKALEEQKEKLEARTSFTHSEIDPIAVLGIACGVMPQGNSGQGPRLTYGGSMGKQAMGCYHYNHHLRFDTSFKLMLNPSRPIFESAIAEPTGLNTMPTGANPIVAFMAHSTNNEDAIKVKEEYINTGNFDLIKYTTHKSVENRAHNEIHEEFKRPETKGTDYNNRHHALNEKGIPRIGAYIRLGDCIIGKERTIVTFTEDGTRITKKENASLYAGIGDEGFVDRVLIVWNISKLRRLRVMKVKIRQRRRPQAGDKFASRYAQKGTISTIVKAKDLPRIEGGVNDGLVPDWFINPHSIPSRMTMGKIKEMLASKAAVYTGERVDATTFHKFDIDYYRNKLAELGMDKDGLEDMALPNGLRVHNKIFVAPCHYDSLRHHVLDKVQMRAHGAIKPISHQPIGGRSNEGGLRVGEMERDAFISHGATSILLERLMEVSDKYRTSICTHCGNFAVCDNVTRTCKCDVSKEAARFGIPTFPYIFKLIIHMLVGMNMNVSLRTIPVIREGGLPEERHLL